MLIRRSLASCCKASALTTTAWRSRIISSYSFDTVLSNANTFFDIRFNSLASATTKSPPLLVRPASNDGACSTPPYHISPKTSSLLGTTSSETSATAKPLSSPPDVETPAQLSRKTAGIVRRAMISEQTRFASNYLDSLSTFVLPFSPKFPSTRLATTALIHCHIRAGQINKAARLVEEAIVGFGPSHYRRKPGDLFLTQGKGIKTKTLEVVIGHLCPTSSAVLAANAAERNTWGWKKMMGARLPFQSESPLLHYQRTDPSKDSASAKQSASEGRFDKSTQMALALLRKARYGRQRRTSEMYERLIDACLLQGEIITGSLLFVLLVRDWQARRVLKTVKSRMEEGQQTETHSDPNYSSLQSKWDPNLPSLPDATRVGLHLSREKLPLPFPSNRMMQKILGEIHYDRQPPDLNCGIRTKDCVVALQQMVKLLQDRALPFSSISPLIKAMYEVPKADFLRVKPNRKSPDYHDGGPGNLYDYCHNVLMYLIHSLPSRPPSPTVRQPHLLPPLDIRSYNSLIHYALRHRLSPALGDSIIRHMTEGRAEPLEPTMTTFNILLRGGSLLRRNDIAAQVVENLKSHSDGVFKEVGNISELLERREAERRQKSDRHSEASGRFRQSGEQGSISATLSRINSEQISVPSLPASISNQKDLYTVTSLITHFTSVGLLDPVPKLISNLPESYASSSYVWTCLLAAAVKHRQMDLENIWDLAKMAEKKSWEHREGGSGGAWCLGIEAYTIMMQFFASKRKAELSSMRRTGIRSPDAFSVVGHQKERLRTWNRALDLHSSMVEQGQDVYDSLISVFHFVKDPVNTVALSSRNLELLRSLKMQLPVPDGRFFNALLDLFGRADHRSRRRWRRKRTLWKRRVHKNEEWISSEEQKRRDVLREIQLEMRTVGLEMPVGFRTLIEDEKDDDTHAGRRMRESNLQRPWAFPPDHRNFLPFQVLTSKSRGLPIR